MEKPSSIVQYEDAQPSNHLDKSMANVKGALANNETEHRLTLGEVWTNHPALIWSSFFWAMCAIGW
jgi:hypothetical protein